MGRSLATLLSAAVCTSLTLVQGIKIAFVGDTGAQTSGDNGYFAKAVFNSLTDDGVDLVIQNGDLDYSSDPEEWDEFIVENALNENMEVLLSSGNHEEQIWYGRPWYGDNGYKARMERRLPASNLLANSCTGDYGERYSCEFGDVLVIMIGWKQTEDAEEVADSADFIRNTFENTNAKFKFCTWHQPEGKYNPGDVHTGNYESQPLYELCRLNGAMVTSGHSHVYGRTKMISSFLPNNELPSDNPDPQISSNDEFDPTLSCGEGFSVVVGMGGYKFDGDGEYADKNYFRTILTSDDIGDRAGALICDVPDNASNNQDALVPCEFKLSTGDVIEEFVITVKESAFGSKCIDNSPPTPSPVPEPDCFLGFIC